MNDFGVKFRLSTLLVWFTYFAIATGSPTWGTALQICFLLSLGWGIVIADYYLPGMLGDEFLGWVASDWPWIRRVMLSGLHAAEIPPGTATLQHPLNESELIKLVRSLVNELEKSQGDTGG